MNRTRTTIIIAILLVLGAGAVWYFMRPPRPAGGPSIFRNLPIIGSRAPGAVSAPSSGIAPEGKPMEAGEPGTTGRPLVQIIEKDILAPTLGARRDSLLYIARENGHVFSSDLNGDNERSVANLTVLEAFEARWAPKKNRVAMFYYEGGAVKKFLNAVATGTVSRFLPQETTSLDWSPDGLSLAYLLGRDSDTALVVADAGNQTPRIVYTTPVPDFTLRWLSKNTLLLVSRPSGLAPSLVMRFELGSRRAEPVLGGASGVVVLPVPDGSGFLFSRSSRGGRAEPLASYTFRDAKTVPLNALTIAEKCAFSPDSKRLFCGIPKNMGGGAMPDEWYKGAVSFSDAIVEIDLGTNQTKALMENTADVDVISPFVAGDGKYLFFQDKKTGTLWRLELGAR